ncbi:MAG TPA: VIT family protein, partial [Acidimicrobiia bacterium]|nr:VIT family protein [Acidimicrobiia bacterium]
HRVGWLRAAVLGANDGIVSTAGLVIGVAAANTSRTEVVTAGIAGLVAGAFSMAAGEYISVSSQRDTEEADRRIEEEALAADPAAELAELTEIYVGRGLSRELAAEVARELMARSPLEAHMRDELGITEVTKANPLQAAWTSALAFVMGAIAPLLAISLPPISARIPATVAVALIALIALGALGARAGGAPWKRAATRVVLWSSLAMAVTYGIGRAVGAAV